MLRGRSRGVSFGILMLGYQLAQFGFDRIPPVTLGTILLNTGIFMGSETSYRLSEVCIGMKQFWSPGGTWRLLASSFHHVHDLHLYYNMISFLWKAYYLERRLRSEYFAYVIGVFSILINFTIIVLNTFMARIFDPDYLYHCSVGFSGVIFALKVLSLEMWPYNRVYLMGFIPINAKYSCWAELILIQILVPQVSFTGHLAGILVGYAYTRGPLKDFMQGFLGVGYSGSRRTYTYTSGTASNEPQQPPTNEESSNRGDDNHGNEDNRTNNSGYSRSNPSYSRSNPSYSYSSSSGYSSNTLRQRSAFARVNRESEDRREWTNVERDELERDTPSNHSDDSNQTEPSQNGGDDLEKMRNKWANFKVKKAKRRCRTIFDL